jgi:Zn-dependent M28 family amino/carboxypeptidase
LPYHGRAKLSLSIFEWKGALQDETERTSMRLQTRWLAWLTASAGLLFPALSVADPEPSLKPALDAIGGDELLGHIKVLASDAFEGRAPGTPGETKSVDYLTGQFKKLGLKPGNPDGTYIQEVPLVGFQATAVAGSIAFGGKTIDLKFPSEWVAVSRRQAERVEVVNSDVVFVGYGVVAPEYGWDDYKGVDVRGKTIVMLINDPAVPDPSDPSKLDPNVFKGRAMTYYGRWTYKYEIASEKGAAAAIIVHETGPAAYPFAVVQGNAKENFDVATVNTFGPASKRVLVESWVSLDLGKALFAAAGQDFDALKKAAVRKDFRPVSLNAKANLSVTNRLRSVRSRNVVAKLEGSDPKRKDEYVVLTAHWDHLGRDTSLSGDQVFNGAADNASGVASLLTLAHAFTKLSPPPKRSLLFLAVTAEEKGLLGAKYYASHPLYPLEKTLANLNMDVINLWGKTRDLVSLGLGQTTLDALIASAANGQGRKVVSDPESEKGLFYRSDHFEFVKQGVPAADVRGGIDYVGKPADFGLKKRAEFTANDYHKVSDEVKPDWDLTGAIDDLRVLAEVAYRVAQGDKYPEWLPGTEFRAKRQAALSAPAPAPAPTRP